MIKLFTSDRNNLIDSNKEYRNYIQMTKRLKSNIALVVIIISHLMIYTKAK
jgi:hypothetical protein